MAEMVTHCHSYYDAVWSRGELSACDKLLEPNFVHRDMCSPAVRPSPLCRLQCRPAMYPKDPSRIAWLARMCKIPCLTCPHLIAWPVTVACGFLQAWAGGGAAALHGATETSTGITVGPRAFKALVTELRTMYPDYFMRVGGRAAAEGACKGAGRRQGPRRTR